MESAAIVVAVLFGLKLAWNVSLPLWSRPKRGVSLHPLVELVLLAVLTVLVGIAGMTWWGLPALLVGVYGVFAIIGSYGLCSLVGVIVKKATANPR